MSAGLCLAVDDVDATTVLGLCELAVARNVRLYKSGRVRRAPWNYRWLPDDLIQCDDTGCRTAVVSMQEDVALVDARGAGSCGSLAAAYAAWLQVHEGMSAIVAVRDLGRGRYHCIAMAHERGVQVALAQPDVSTYDPAKIGAR